MRLSVLVPTYNEAANIPALVARCRSALEGIEAELLVLDDTSPDGTADLADAAAPGFCRAVRRTGPRGLGHAVLEGFGRARGACIAVMDADLQHPPEKLRDLLEVVEKGEADLAVGSRRVTGGGTEGWSLIRRAMSRFACILARPVTGVRDATSGFFLCRREVVDGVAFNPTGFKIGLEVMVRGRWKRVVEVPYTFRPRLHGSSKLGAAPVLSYIAHLVSLWPHRRR